jgi:ABC-type multidrug transport system permease subunit
MIMIIALPTLVELFSNTIIFFVITAFKMVTNDEIEFGLRNKFGSRISSLIAEVLKFVSNLPPFLFLPTCEYDLAL